MVQSGLGWARNSNLRSDRLMLVVASVLQMQSTGQIRGLGRDVNGQIRSNEQATRVLAIPYALGMEYVPQ